MSRTAAVGGGTSSNITNVINVVSQVPVASSLNESSVYSFLADYELYKSRGGDKTMAVLLAREVVQALELVDFSKSLASPFGLSADVIVEKLLLSLYAPTSVGMVYDRLKSIKMSSALQMESVLKYISEWDRTINMVSVSLKPSENIIVKTFVSGLRPDRLSRNIYAQEFVDYGKCKAAVVKEYLRLISIVTEAKDLNVGFGNSHNSVMGQGHKSTSNYPNRGNHKQSFNHHNNGIRNVSQDVASNSNSSSAEKVNQPVKVEKKIVCYECGKDGHKRPDCPQLKSAGKSAVGSPVPNRNNNNTIKKEASLNVLNLEFSSLPEFNVTIDENLSAVAIFDTGATHNFISRAFWENNLMDSSCKVDEISPVTVTAFSGEKMIANSSMTLKTATIMADGEKVFFYITYYILQGSNEERIIIGYPTLLSTGLISKLVDPISNRVDDEDDIAFEGDLDADTKYDGDPDVKILVQKYENVFKPLGSLTLDGASVPALELRLISDPPAPIAPRRWSPARIEVLKQLVDEAIQNGVIVSSLSPYAAAPVLQKKPDGSWRLCVDYRKLNECLQPLQFPLPNAQQLLQKLGGFKIYSKLDIKQFFHNIPLAEKSQELTAFATPFGLYQYRRVPMD